MSTKRSAMVWGLIAALVFVSAFGAYAESLEGPRVALSTTEIDLGQVKPVDGIERIVEVRNTGTETLKVSQIKALCTCVEVATSSLVVKPGAAASFAIQAMLSTYPSNEVKGKVRLYTNDAHQPERDITVRAAIVPEYVLEPAELNFGTLKAGESAAQTFVVRQNGDQALQVQRVEASEGLSVSLEEIRPKKEEGQDQPKRYAVAVTLEPGAPMGIFRGKVTVFTNCGRIPKAEVNVSAQVVGLSYSVTPKVLAFGTASPGDMLGTFVVEGAGITVTEAQSDHDGLVLKVSEVEAGKRYRVEISASDGATGERLLSSVTLRVGDEALSEEVTVRVYGRIE